MRIEIIPCLSDNYAYLVVSETGEAAIVDPSEAGPVLEIVKQEGVDLVAIWNTHHHWDHTGGNEELLGEFPRLRVYGHVSDRGRIPGQTDDLVDGAEVLLGELRAAVIHNPGHTLGAVTYVVEGAAFTGDTMFGAGCGRIFEGDPEMMLSSLERIAKLPPQTLVYCGHEYTANNIAFARGIEPANERLRAREEHAQRERAAGRPTVPSTVAEERETNPFLRARIPEVARKMGTDTPVDTFAALRKAKDSF